jgi:PAS domain S-box-containing protein
MFNHALAELWGRTPQIGKDLWWGGYRILNIDGTDLPLEESPMAVCLREQRKVLGKEIIIVRPDGTRRYVAPQPQPFFDDEGNFAGAINMLIDITDIKLTEQALRESEHKYRDLAATLEKKVEEKAADLNRKNQELKKSEERYHKMVDEVEDYAILLMDTNGIIQNWNKGAEKIKGYKEEEIVGKSFELFYTPEDRQNNIPQKLIAEAKEKGKAVIEGWRVKKDGSWFWGSIVLTALHDEMNNIIGFSKVTRDLTARKLAEDHMRRYNSNLEFQNRELEQFVYAASHDLKEPLRKIHLYHSYIQDNASSTLDERSRDYLQRSLNSLKKMSNLIEDLLSYSRTSYNTESVTLVDMDEVLDEVINDNSEDMEEHKVIIEREPMPRLHAIAFQCKQLFENLLTNAVKYRHPDRQPVIRISSSIVDGAEIHDENAELNKKYCRITVEDNGIGFEPQYAEKIFKIFQRLNNQPSTGGSGIGLAICKRIAQNHNGFISATGSPGKGARFDTFFPYSH